MVPEDKDVTFPFKFYGRPICSEGDSLGNAPDSVDPPSPLFTTGDVLDFFESNFGFSDKEAVAIMGAHTLGRLARENSGMPDAQWVRRRGLVLDNEYYKQLFSTNNAIQPTDKYSQRSMRTNGQLCYFWQRKEDDEEAAQVQTQTLGGGPPPPGGVREIMLNSDVALISDFAGHLVNEETGSVDCVIQSGPDDVREECPMASTFGYA